LPPAALTKEAVFRRSGVNPMRILPLHHPVSASSGTPLARGLQKTGR
jgi:hypothetical protein